MRKFIMREDESILKQVDILAKSRGSNRSAFYREAVRLLLEQQKERVKFADDE